METRTLDLFVACARRGSFAAVARERNLDPSAVSRAIGQLEEQLGARLFQRTTRAMHLTESGARFLERLGPALEELELACEALTDAQSGPRGRLRITTSTAFGQCMVVPLVGRFRECFPELELELLMSDGSLDLIAEGIDIAIRHGPVRQEHLVARRLRRTRYRVCASPVWLKRNGTPDSPAALADAGCVLYTFPEFRERWRFREPATGAEQRVDVRGALAVSNALALRTLTEAGEGPGLLADWLVEEALAAGRLVDLFPRFAVTATRFDTAIHLVWPTRSQLPGRVRHAIDFLLAELGDRSP